MLAAAEARVPAFGEDGLHLQFTPPMREGSLQSASLGQAPLEKAGSGRWNWGKLPGLQKVKAHAACVWVSALCLPHPEPALVLPEKYREDRKQKSI